MDSGAKTSDTPGKRLNEKSPEDLSATVTEVLDGDNTVALCSDVSPGETTITFRDARSKFALVGKQGRRYPVGDADSTIFIRSDGGELSVGYGPEFAPVEAAVKVCQYELATSQLARTYTSFDLHVDDAGLVAIESDDTAVVICPQIFPWDKPSTEGTACGPRGPSI